MSKRLRMGALVLACMLAALLGVANVGLARAQEGTSNTTTLTPVNQAVLTKVIIASEGTNASVDTFSFQFKGAGLVRDATDGTNNLVVDDVVQDSTLQAGDRVPSIPNAVLQGVQLTASNSNYMDGLYQVAVQKPMSEVLQNVTFPHAGVYTYRVSEVPAFTNLTDGTMVNPSGAEYILRVYVQNTKDASGNDTLEVAGVTVEQDVNDDGNAIDKVKVNPKLPVVAGNKISGVSAGEIAGDERGRDVDGFTFANEYLKGGGLIVKKFVTGSYADKNKQFYVKLELYDPMTKQENAQGAVATYVIIGGVDATTANLNSNGIRPTLDGVDPSVEQTSHTMIEYDKTTGKAVIEAYLRDGGSIQVTGEFGPDNPAFASDPQNQHPGDTRMRASVKGPRAGTDFTVWEEDPGAYLAAGYLQSGTMTALNTMTAEQVTQNSSKTSQDMQTAGLAGRVVSEGDDDGLLVAVVNTLDESNVSPTGIVLDHVPYLLLVGVPVAFFAGSFVAKRLRKRSI